MQYNNAKISLQFRGDFSKQNKVTYSHGKIVNIYIVYRFSPHTSSTHTFTLKDCLFGVINLTKNSDPDKYQYSGYGMGFNSRGSFTHPDGDYGVNIINFGCDLSNSYHANNRANSILNSISTRIKWKNTLCRKNAFT